MVINLMSQPLLFLYPPQLDGGIVATAPGAPAEVRARLLEALREAPGGRAG
jgi:hypothetical protein